MRQNMELQPHSWGQLRKYSSVQDGAKPTESILSQIQIEEIQSIHIYYPRD